MDLYFTNFRIFGFHRSIFHELYFNPCMHLIRLWLFADLHVFFMNCVHNLEISEIWVPRKIRPLRYVHLLFVFSFFFIFKVEGIKMIVRDSQQLEQCRNSFFSSVGNIVEIANDKTSSHQSVAERISDLKVYKS